MVGQLRTQLAQIDQSIQSEIGKLAARAKNDYLAAKHSEDMLRGLFEAQKGEANRLNDKAVQYTILKQDVESSRSLYDGLLGKLKEGGILSGLRLDQYRCTRPSAHEPNPVTPKLPLNLGVGFVFGLFGGIALAFVRDGLDDTLYTPEDVETAATLPCVGIVPNWQALPSFCGVY